MEPEIISLIPPSVLAVIITHTINLQKSKGLVTKNFTKDCTIQVHVIRQSLLFLSRQYNNNTLGSRVLVVHVYSLMQAMTWHITVRKLISRLIMIIN